jgi:hypothetical protein
MRALPLLPVLPALLLVAACDREGGSTLSINSDAGAGNGFAATVSNQGEVAINSPVFSGKLKLPKLDMDAEDFDMNGVHLYPGSRITGIDVRSSGKQREGGKDDGQVRVSFDSPAAPQQVLGWFQDKLNHAGYSVAPAGSALTGTTEEKQPFRMELSPAGEGKAKGTILIG